MKLWRKGVVPKEEIYKGSEATSYYIRRSGQFIYGKLDFLNQAFGIVPKELDGYESTMDSPAFNISKDLNPTFLIEYVTRKQFYLYQGTLANGSRKAKRIHAETFLDMPFTLPNIYEQTKIGNFFKQLDNTVALYQEKLMALKKIKTAFSEKIFNQEIRFSGFDGAWEQCKLGDVTKDTYGGGTPKTQKSEYWEGDVPWIQSSDIQLDEVSKVVPKKFISGDAIINSAAKIIPENSIAIVTRVGVGKLAFMPYFYATSQDFLSLSKLTVSPWFAVYSIYNLIKKEINNIQGTSIKGITKADLLDKQFKVPVLETEQSMIGNFFKQLDETIALHCQKIDSLQKLKHGYLKKMFL